MVLNVLLTWNEFWQSVGEFFKNFFDSLYVFWINPSYHDETITEPPFLGVFIFAVIFLIVGFFVIKLILIIARRFMRLDKNKFIKDRSFKRFLYNTFKYILYIVLFILFFLILGIELTGVSTIISSALLAIGLSLQDVISNFASGLIILTSKPFVTDDYVLFNSEGVEGNVIDVRFLTTILKTVDGQIVTIPNKNITNATITNYSNNPERRVNICLKVDLEQDFEVIKDGVLKIFNANEDVLKDFYTPTVLISEFQNNYMIVSCRCYVPGSKYWDIVFDFNKKIYEFFKANNIKLAFEKVKVLDKEN